MSEKMIDIFLDLLDCFLNQKQPQMQRALSEDEGMQLYRMASEHHVTAMIYDVLGSSGVFEQVPEKVRMMFRQAAFQDVLRQTRKTQLFYHHYNELCNKGVKPLVLKGIICRNLYAKPDCRPSGDEDMLIRESDFQLVDEYFTANGFIRDKDCQRDMIPEEMGYRNLSNGAYYEIHTRLFSESSDAYGHFNREFGHVFEQQITVNIEGTDVRTMDAASHFVYLCAHCMKHFLHGGVGIRQVCDIVMFASAYGHEIDWKDFWSIAKRLKMDCYCVNLLDIGEKYFGFSYEQTGAVRLDMTADSRALLLDIMDSGVFGKTSSGRMHSANITLQAAGQKTDSKLAGGIWKSLFPDRNYMSKSYTYVKKYPFLLWWAYVQRILNYRNEQKQSSEEMSSLQIGMQRVELLKKYGIIKR